MEKIHVQKMLRMEYSLKDIIDYFRGNLRYVIYVNAPYLLMPHIRQQIDLRIRMMDKECYEKGSCKLCGCEVPELQMANKSCDGNCYPPMMKAWQWKRFKGSYNEDPYAFNAVRYGYFGVKNGDWINLNEPDEPFDDVSLIKFEHVEE